MIRFATALQAPNSDWEVPEYAVLLWAGKTKNHCIVIPVVNEGSRIGNLLARMADLRIPDLADIIIIDGGSSDGSLDDSRLQKAGVRGLLLKTGPGKLSAQLRCAYAFALREGYEGVITIDGNDKDDPSAIPKFISALESGFDFLQASRFIEGGVEANTPWLRHAAIRCIHAPALSIASGFAWTDTTQGFRGYSRRLLADQRLLIFRTVFDSYELLAYLSARAPRLGFRCLEIATARRYPPGKPPTKIAGLKGNLQLLTILLRACMGGYNPPRSASAASEIA